MRTMNWNHTTMIGAVLLAILSAVSVPVTASQEEPPAEEATDDEREKARETYVLHEEVFVDGGLPEIPTSNTVAAKLPLSLRETPASVGVVDARLIAEQDGITLGDALGNISGLNVQPGSGTFDFFILRGLDSLSSGLILTDGAPEPGTTAYLLYNVERVEVFKGPAAFLYGGKPLGGVVNLVREQPHGRDFVRFGTSFGSFATYEATLDANVSNAPASLSFRLNSTYQQAENYRDDKDSETFAVNPAFTWRPSDRTSVNVNFEHVDLEYQSDTGLPLLYTNELPDVPRTRSYQSPFDISEQRVERFQIDVETRLSSTVALRNKTYYRNLDWFSRTTTFNGVFPDALSGLQVSRVLLELDDAQEYVGNQFEVLWKFGEGSVIHNLLAGVELARLADEFTFCVAFLPDIDLYDPVETAQEPFVFPTAGADARSVVTSPYLVDQITFSEKFQLLLGARYDLVDFEDDLTGTARDDAEVSPMVGAVFLPTSTLSLYANFGEAFAPPSTFVVAEDRLPEESRQFEVGIKKEFLEGKLRSTLAFYRIDRENLAIPDSATGVLQQTGDQRSQGVEFELSAEVRPGLRTFLAYAFTDSELTEFRELIPISTTDSIVVDRSGNTPPFTPDHLLSFWVSKEIPGGWRIGGGGRYVGEQFIAEDNAFKMDDYLLLDAALSYTRGAWRLFVNVKNLTDEEYYTRTSRGNSLIPTPGTVTFGGFQVTF